MYKYTLGIVREQIKYLLICSTVWNVKIDSRRIGALECNKRFGHRKLYRSRRSEIGVFICMLSRHAKKKRGENLRTREKHQHSRCMES